jgi:hypothetical protein
VYVLYYCEKEEKDVLERSLSIELISGARDVRMCGSAAAAAGRCSDGYAKASHDISQRRAK